MSHDVFQAEQELAFPVDAIFRPRPRRVWHFYPLAKRGVDIVAATIGLVLLAPVLLIVSALIKAESSGTVFFKQTRVGIDGREFKMWKFRSMRQDSEACKAELMAKAEVSDGVRFKMVDDPRVTRLGKFIRKYSIDELPQLFNIFRGEMTLVGPRPALPEEVALYTPYQRSRLHALPGLTCTWQVSGRSDIPFERQVDMDIDYIHSASLMQDLRLLLKTVPAVLAARGSC